MPTYDRKNGACPRTLESVISLNIAGFRALIGELFPVVSYPTLFSCQIHPPVLGTSIAPLGEGFSLGQGPDRVGCPHGRVMFGPLQRPLDEIVLQMRAEDTPGAIGQGFG